MRKSAQMKKNARMCANVEERKCKTPETNRLQNRMSIIYSEYMNVWDL